ncbi:MAG: hypothetical protein H0W27_01705 [Actinobacteria bacterium]|nr:hypothetical protein [Actinomycetota bacterium]
MAQTFIVVDGNTGTGKSTVARSLAARLDAALFHYPAPFVRFRDDARLDSQLEALPRLLYYLAATVHLSDLVGAELARGRSVVCDRYLAAPLSLLAADGSLAEGDLQRWTELIEPSLRRPDLTLILVSSHAAAAARLTDSSRASGAAATPLTEIQGRTVRSPKFFFRRQAALFRFAVRLGPVAELDTTSLGPEEMRLAAFRLVDELPRH